MSTYDLAKEGTDSRIEQQLTGAGYSAPISRLERIIDGEDIKPLSRIEDKMKTYIAEHSSGSGGAGMGLDDYSEIKMLAINAEDITSIPVPKVTDFYDPHGWMWIGDGGANTWFNMPGFVDSNDKWHVYAKDRTAHSLGNGGIYLGGAIDISKVRAIEYHLVQGNWEEPDKRDDHQIVIALVNKYMNVAYYWPDRSETIKYKSHQKYYEVENQLYPVTDIIGSISVEDIDEPAYLVYWEYGSELTFESVNFVLK